MSVANLKNSGNKGNNFPFQLKVLQALGSIVNNSTPRAITPQIVLATESGGLEVSCLSISFTCISGKWTLVFGGSSAEISPGITITMDAGDFNDYYPEETFSWVLPEETEGKLLITCNLKPK